MKKYQPPEKLNVDTPDWFREWHDSTFWHFKYRVEDKLSTHSKILWLIFAVVVVSIIVKFFTG